jgi:hypothetical protein
VDKDLVKLQALGCCYRGTQEETCADPQLEPGTLYCRVHYDQVYRRGTRLYNPQKVKAEWDWRQALEDIAVELDMDLVRDDHS